MHCKGMNFTNFLLQCKGAILKADFFATHTVSRQTQCPPHRLSASLLFRLLPAFVEINSLLDFFLIFITNMQIVLQNVIFEKSLKKDFPAENAGNMPTFIVWQFF